MWPAIIGLLGSMMGNQASQQQQSAANDNAKNALMALQGVALPDINAMHMNPANYQSVGNLNPLTEQAVQQGQTNLNNVTVDPAYNQYTMDALQKIAQTSNQGLNDIDRAQLNSVLNQSAQQNRSQQKSILENRAARGMGGSGDELAAQLAAAQSGSNAASNNAMAIAAQAAQRKLDATDKTAALAQALGNTDYSRQANKANAADVIANFNARQMGDTQARNVAGLNQAQAANLSNNQNIANQNTGLSNQAQQYNKQLLQQQFSNALQRAGGSAAQYNNIANMGQVQANNTGNMWGQIGSGLIKGIGASQMNNSTPKGATMSDEEPTVKMVDDE